MNTNLERLFSGNKNLDNEVANELIDKYLFNKNFPEVVNLMSSGKFENELIYNLKREPGLSLISPQGKGVFISNEKDYNFLMRIQEIAGYTWTGGFFPTQSNYQNLPVYPIIITFDESRKELGWNVKSNYKKNKTHEIISFKQFCKFEGITQKLQNEINSFFELNNFKANRREML